MDEIILPMFLVGISPFSYRPYWLSPIPNIFDMVIADNPYCSRMDFISPGVGIPYFSLYWEAPCIGFIIGESNACVVAAIIITRIGKLFSSKNTGGFLSHQCGGATCKWTSHNFNPFSLMDKT